MDFLSLGAWLFLTLILLVVIQLKFGVAPRAKRVLTPQEDDLSHLVGTFGSLNDDTEKNEERKKSKHDKRERKVEKNDQACCSTEESQQGCCNSGGDCCKNSETSVVENKPMVILYGTQSGSAEDLARSLYKEASSKGYSAELRDMATYDPEALCAEPLVVMIISTYTNGTPPPTAASFHAWIMDEGENERNGNMMRTVRYAVFGLGNSLYSKHFNQAGRDLDFAMHKMGGQRVFWRGESDESSDIGAAFEKWRSTLWMSLASRSDAKDDDDDEGLVYNGEDDYESSEEEEEEAEPLVDLEDLGSMMKKGDGADKPVFGKKMLSESQKAVLSKQGYRVIGSHSGVKMCRWTKAMLRGRGGCYKHTFYGIASHRCMETTPSMACANKCVFCWRHHKNPVGTEWRWEMDPPETIVNGAIESHYKMIKIARGIPGVRPERLKEAFEIKHCALSLVGEPILYPEINKYLELLHQKGISSFMVTNAQFPGVATGCNTKRVCPIFGVPSNHLVDRIAQLKPVTQLYISVDAATPESLKIVDRPLFPDYWERFLACIDELSKKGQRTVFRLTLIKGWNTEEIQNYASLITRGKPDFVEIKGVTFCGGKRPQVLMENVPWHDEVVRFTKEIAKHIEGYEIASEHEHSCCVLLANASKFKKDGVWNTWIDFDKFIELDAAGQPFSSLDYMAPTPDWATYGHKARGFNPTEYSIKLANRPKNQGC